MMGIGNAAGPPGPGENYSSRNDEGIGKVWKTKEVSIAFDEVTRKIQQHEPK